MRRSGTRCWRNGSCISRECSSRCGRSSATTTPPPSSEARGHGLVDHGTAQRRLEGAAVVQRDAVERGAVRRPHEHGDQAGAAAQRRVGVRGHRARIAQPGVRRDEADQPARQRRRGNVREVAVDLGADGARIPRVPRPRDRRGADRARVHPRRLLMARPCPGRKLAPTRYSSRGNRSRLMSVVDRSEDGPYTVGCWESTSRPIRAAMSTWPRR